MTMSVSLGLRWGDLDAQGHINNVTYLELLQEARVQFLQQGGLSLLDDGVVVTAHQVEYVRAIDDISKPVTIHVHSEDVGGARFTLAYTVEHGGTTALRARTTCAAFDFDDGSLRKLSAAEREFLAKHQSDSLDLREVPSVPLRGRGYLSELPVRWSDQDWYHHVNNVKYYGYLQEARIRFTTEIDPTATRSGSGDASFMWLIARQDCSYLGQMFYRDEPYFVRSGVAKIGSTSITMVADIVDSPEPDADVLASSTCVLVCADGNGPTALSDSLREGMTPYLVD